MGDCDLGGCGMEVWRERRVCGRWEGVKVERIIDVCYDVEGGCDSAECAESS